MAIDKDLEAFESAYAEEVKEIIVLTSDANGGAGRNGGAAPGGAEVLWTASAYILAYVDCGSGELKPGDGRLQWPLTDEEMKEHSFSWPYNFKKETIYRLKVRELRDKTVPNGMLSAFGNRFLVVEVLEENACDERLLDILTEYRKPVVVNDKELGEFVLNKQYDQFEGQVDWLGEEVFVVLEVSADNRATWTKALNALRKLVADQEAKDQEFKAFAAMRLTALANDWRQQEEGKDAAEITREEFAGRIGLSELSLTSGGKYIAWYNDDDMFFGHVITVYGSLNKGVETANIEG